MMELLADVGLGRCAASCAAWCPVNGIVAVGSHTGPGEACVHLLSVHCPSRKVVLRVPLAGPDDELVVVAWSPPGCRRVLLTATRAGRLGAWSQTPPEPGAAQQQITLEDWWPHDVADLGAPAAAAAGGGGNDSGGDGGAVPRLVCVRWLAPPPAWPWNAGAASVADLAGASIQELFLPGAADAAQQQQQPEPANPFHWVRPGTLALAAVLSDGSAVLAWAQWAAYGQLAWSTTAPVQLAPPAARVVAADAAACADGVAVCFALADEPGTLRLATVLGSPPVAAAASPEAPPALALAQRAPHALHGGGNVTGVSWDPASNGTRLAVATSSGDGGSLRVCRVAGEELSEEGPAPCAAGVQQAQLAWLLDGLAAWSGGPGLALLTLGPLAPAPGGTATPPVRRRCAAGGARALVALAASPHGLGVAAVLAGGGSGGGGGAPWAASSRLLLFNAPAAAARPGDGGDGSPSPAARPAAARLLWALLQQRHSWDAVQHVVCGAARGGGGGAGGTRVVDPAAIGAALSIVDAALAVQPPTLKSNFWARWDVLKVALLAATPGDLARCLSVDLRLRLLSQMLKPTFDVMREDGALRQREARPKLPALAPLHAYMVSLMSFHLACLKTWTARRAGLAPGDAGAVPCVRHFLDWRPCNILLLLHYLTCGASGGRDDALYPALKAFIKAAPPKKDAPWEDAVRELFPGPLQLHFGDAFPESLGSVSLPAGAMLQHMASCAVWEAQAPLTDAQITAAATRLGLLPARPPKSAALFTRELQLHEGFRQALPEPGACAASQARGGGAALKRRRWEAALGDALGDTLGPAAGAAVGVMDLAHLVELQPGAPALLLSADGYALAGAALPPLGEEGGTRTVPRVLADQCSQGWTLACPVSGEGQRRRRQQQQLAAMDWLFGKRKTPAEILRENKRMLDKAMRELDRERVGLQNQEKKTIAEIKKMAKEGQMDAVKVMAKSLIRNRHAVTKLHALKSQLQAVSLRIQTLKSTQSMADAMRGATQAMRVMNRRMNLPNMQKILMEFERQNERMEMTSDMMGDAIDDAMEGEAEEEETDELIGQVLDEIGITTTTQLVSAPDMPVAAAAPAAALPAMAEPMGAGGGAGPSAAAGPGIDEDLQARLDNLRKT
ncbi:VPS2.1 [Scenedesmus sp. PABB004]|nr:VPS2.1 [Scenedesmus sp. PABB004]